MNSNDLAKMIAEDCEVPVYKAQEMLGSLRTRVLDALSEGDEIRLPSFGKFTPHDVAAHERANNFAGTTMKVSARRKVRFTAFPSVVRMLTESVTPVAGWDDD